jgi:hypothetical protein
MSTASQRKTRGEKSRKRARDEAEGSEPEPEDTCALRRNQNSDYSNHNHKEVVSEPTDLVSARANYTHLSYEAF